MLRIEGGRDEGPLVLLGELDMATVVDLLKAVTDVPFATVRLDLSGVTFIDVSGIRALLAISGSLGGGGELILVSPHARVRRVLELLGIDHAGWFRMVEADEDVNQGGSV